MCLVAWPLNESDAGVDLVLIETSLLCYVDDSVLMLISSNLHKKGSEAFIKQGQLQPHFHTKARQLSTQL